MNRLIGFPAEIDEWLMRYSQQENFSLPADLVRHIVREFRKQHESRIAA